MPTTNATHRKRLARALAAHSGTAYLTALNTVNNAAARGLLPSTLDEAGMAAALRILTSTHDATLAEAGPVPQAPDVRIMRFSDIKGCPKMSLAPSHFRADGMCKCRDSHGNTAPRQATDPRDQQIWDLSFEYERLTGSQGLVYIESPGQGADRYVFGGRYTALGRVDALRHVMGLAARASATHGESIWQMPTQPLVHAAVPAVPPLAADQPRASRTHGTCGVCAAPIRYTAHGQKWVHLDPHGNPGPVAAGSPNLATYQTVQATPDLLTTVRTRVVDTGRVVMVDGLEGAGLADSHTERLYRVWPFATADDSLTLIPAQSAVEPPALRAILSLDLSRKVEAGAEHVRVLTDLTGVAIFDPLTGNLRSMFRLPAHTGDLDQPDGQAPVRGREPQGARFAEPTSLDPSRDRLGGGPYRSKVTDARGRSVNAVCDVCDRRLNAGEPWWIVVSTHRGWENNGGVSCAQHAPELLPVESHTDAAQRDQTVRPE